MQFSDMVAPAKDYLYSYFKQTEMSFFSKMGNMKVKQILFGGWHQCVGRGYKERV
jgi:hypothetical protein